MDKDVDLFSDYIKDNSIKGRVKDPRTWVNLLILIVIIIMAVILIRSIQNSWSKKEIKNTIKIIDYDSRWVIKSSNFTGDKNTVIRKEIAIVPRIRFRIKNIGKRNLEHVRLIGNFVYAEKRNVSIGDGYADVLKNTVLKPGETSDFISIKSTYGYKTTTTGDEDFEDMFFKKKGWKKFNVRISARVKGTIKEIAEKPVKNKFDKLTGNESNKNIDKENIKSVFLNSLKVDSFSSEWIHKKIKGKNLFIPTVLVKIKNSGKKNIEKLIISVIFEFDDKKGIVNQWKGKNVNFIKGLNSKKISNELYFEAEYGIEATSVEKLFLNKKEWKNTSAKIYVGIKGDNPVLFKSFSMKQNVKGYKIRIRRT